MAFNEQLRARRQELGLTQKELANAAGLGVRAIAYLEGGQRYPTADTARKLAEALNTSVDYLLSGADTYIADAQERGGIKAARDVDALVSEVRGMFAGGTLSEDALDGVMKSISEAYWEAKEKNKKYTPKKYLKEQGDTTEE